MKFIKYASIIFISTIVLLWIVNTSAFTPIQQGQVPKLIAHRGVHHIYAGDDRSNDTCRAAKVEPISHNFIENTVSSMKAAFDYGADVVEIDVHLTPDKIFAVYHDWRLECQTDGAGVTHKKPYSYLKKLDLGYNISIGDGTYPFRGKAVGQMPSLSQVFDEKMKGLFLINFKSNREEEGEHLANLISNPTYKKQVFGAYGGDVPLKIAIQKTKNLRGYSKPSLFTCLKDYVLLAWSGYVPTTCANMFVAVPQNYASYFWGWPHKFIKRMQSVGSEVILLGPYDGTGFSSGIDSPAALDNVPQDFDGYIWTNRIEVIGPLVKLKHK